MYKDKLDKKELGHLLRLIADELSNESEVSKVQLFNYFQAFCLPINNDSCQPSIANVNNIKSLLLRFRTGDELREFIQVVYKRRVPYRLSKEIINYVAIGIIFSSDISIKTASSIWEDRNFKLSKIDIYHESKKGLFDVLNDSSLFPDGYSIASFAKRSHMSLPKMEGKELPIQVLMEKLFERPLSTKKIGRWGLPDEEKM